MSDEDRLQLEAWRAGDRQAGTALFRRHFAAIYRFFVNKVPLVADELTQRTFLACVERRDDISVGFRPYLFGIARNVLLTYLRTQGRWSDRFEHGDVSIEAVLDSPSQVVADHEQERALLGALRRLSFDLQTTVELYYWEQLGVEAIGEILGVPSGTIKSRLARARDMLRVELGGMGLAPPVVDATIDDLEQWATRLRARLQPTPSR